MARAKNALTVAMKLPTDDELKKMFDAVPQLQRFKVTSKAVKAASKVVETRASQLAPRSKPADQKKRSKKQKAEANWTGVPLHTTIKHVVRDYENSSSGFIGPAWPHGNKAYFNQPRNRSRKHILWGQDVGRIYVATRNWIVQAFDETQSAQLAAMKASLKDSIDKIMGSMNG